MPWVVALADIVPTDKKPPVIVPRFDTVILEAVIEPFSSTTNAPPAAVSVPVDVIEEAVTEPVALIVEAVIEPALFTTKPVEVPPLLICNAYCGVVVPMPILPVVVIVPVDAIEEAVTEPVVVMVVAVMEPEVSTLKPPALPAVIEPVVVNVDTVVEPAFMVPVVFILLALPKEVAVIPLNPEPFPINFAAVSVPVTSAFP